MKKGIIAGLIASTLMLISPIASSVAKADTTTTSAISYAQTGVVTTNHLAFLYKLDGSNLKLVTDRALGPNTPWYFDQIVKGADGITYYRVATNEWVGSNYLGAIKGNPVATKPNTSTNTNNNNTSDLGNVSTAGKIIGNSDSKIYHMPYQKTYSIKIKHAVYFNTEQEAINAGYRKSLR